MTRARSSRWRSRTRALQRHMTVAAFALGVAQIPFLIALATARRAPPIEAGRDPPCGGAAAPRRTSARLAASPPGRRCSSDRCSRATCCCGPAVPSGRRTSAAGVSRSVARRCWWRPRPRARPTRGRAPRRRRRSGAALVVLAVNAARRRVQGRAHARYRTWNSRRGSRSPVCCSPCSRCVCGAGGVECVPSPSQHCPRGRAWLRDRLGIAVTDMARRLVRLLARVTLACPICATPEGALMSEARAPARWC